MNSSTITDDSSSSCHQNPFGALTNLDADVATPAFIIIVGTVVVIERAFHFLYQLTQDTPFQNMVSKLEKELMIVGSTAFILKVIMSLSTSISDSWNHSIDFADVLVPIIAFCFCLQGVTVIFISTHHCRVWSKAYHLTTYELCDDYYQCKMIPLSIMNYASWTQYCFNLSKYRRILSELSFRVFHIIFCEEFRIQRKSFEFDQYVELMYERVVLSLITIRPVDWLLVIVVAIVNYVGQKNMNDSCKNEDEDCVNQLAMAVFLGTGVVMLIIIATSAAVGMHYISELLAAKGVFKSDNFPVLLHFIEEQEENIHRHEVQRLDLSDLKTMLLAKKEKLLTSSRHKEAKKADKRRFFRTNLSFAALYKSFMVYFFKRDVDIASMAVRNASDSQNVRRYIRGDAYVPPKKKPGFGVFGSIGIGGGVGSRRPSARLVTGQSSSSIATGDAYSLGSHAEEPLSVAALVSRALGTRGVGPVSRGSWVGVNGGEGEADLLERGEAGGLAGSSLRHSRDQGAWGSAPHSRRTSTDGFGAGSVAGAFSSAGSGSRRSSHRGRRRSSATSGIIGASDGADSSPSYGRPSWKGSMLDRLNSLNLSGMRGSFAGVGGTQTRRNSANLPSEAAVSMLRIAAIDRQRKESQADSVSNLFWFGNHAYYLRVVQYLGMFIAAYNGLLLVNFIALSSHSSIAWQIAIIAISPLNCLLYFSCVRAAVIFKLVCELDIDAMESVIEDSEALKQVSVSVREKLISRLSVLGDPRTSLAQLFVELDDHNNKGTLSQEQFKELLGHMGLFFSRRRWDTIFRAIDVTADDQISMNEFYLFLFPENAEMVRKERLRLRLVKERVGTFRAKSAADFTASKSKKSNRHVTGLMMTGSGRVKVAINAPSSPSSDGVTFGSVRWRKTVKDSMRISTGRSSTNPRTSINNNNNNDNNSKSTKTKESDSLGGRVKESSHVDGTLLRSRLSWQLSVAAAAALVVERGGNRDGGCIDDVDASDLITYHNTNSNITIGVADSVSCEEGSGSSGDSVSLFEDQKPDDDKCIDAVSRGHEKTTSIAVGNVGEGAEEADTTDKTDGDGGSRGGCTPEDSTRLRNTPPAGGKGNEDRGNSDKAKDVSNSPADSLRPRRVSAIQTSQQKQQSQNQKRRQTVSFASDI